MKELRAMSPTIIAAEDRINAPAAYERLTAAEQEALQRWIALAIAPAVRAESRHSYGIKHDFEKVGFYVTNGQFKGAMLAAGYEPTPASKKDLNWCFKIRPRRPVTRKEAASIQGCWPSGKGFYGIASLSPAEQAEFIALVARAKVRTP